MMNVFFHTSSKNNEENDYFELGLDLVLIACLICEEKWVAQCGNTKKQVLGK